MRTDPAADGPPVSFSQPSKLLMAKALDSETPSRPTTPMLSTTVRAKRLGSEGAHGHHGHSDLLQRHQAKIEKLLESQTNTLADMLNRRVASMETLLERQVARLQRQTPAGEAQHWALPNQPDPPEANPPEQEPISLGVPRGFSEDTVLKPTWDGNKEIAAKTINGVGMGHLNGTDRPLGDASTCDLEDIESYHGKTNYDECDGLRPTVLHGDRNSKGAFRKRASMNTRPSRLSSNGIHEDSLKLIEELKVRKNQRDEILEREHQLSEYRTRVKAVVESEKFQVLISVVLLLCAVTIAAESEVQMSNLQQRHKVFRVFDVLWSVVFALELALRLFAQGRYYCSRDNADFGWNVMDTLLVLLSIMDEIMMALDYASSFFDVSTLRVLRMLRLVRVLRLLRVLRFMTELRIMVNGIAFSSKQLVWALVLLGAIMSMFSIMTMQLAAMDLRDSTDQQHERDVRTHYGSFGRTLLTLFMMITGGIDWWDASRQLSYFQGYTDYIFAMYIMFQYLVVMNVITGIFVENAKSIRENDREARHLMQIEQRRKWIQDVADLFSYVDIDIGGDISRDEFVTRLEDPRVQTCFDNLGINMSVYTVDELFDMFDYDSSGNINTLEFSAAMKSLHGQARSIDLYKVRRDLRRVVAQIGDINALLARIVKQPGVRFNHAAPVTR